LKAQPDQIAVAGVRAGRALDLEVSKIGRSQRYAAEALGADADQAQALGLAVNRLNESMRVETVRQLARVRFLLADDAGAGKTIMAGLLLRELKLRGLADRILVVCPANLTFQWQRENEHWPHPLRGLRTAWLRAQYVWESSYRENSAGLYCQGE